ncbi:hypothetical protein EKG35_05450 [Lysinibacillus telephonicus]|uniref:Uncharacterized protein n=1 Tax=Lysinibacillus telephonicus TaxID=1714840 RepID=A0A431UV00_9BACI|nr:hypothetical protein EKG35_05450 [Lysinibacillus telephonicus]
MVIFPYFRGLLFEILIRKFYKNFTVTCIINHFIYPFHEAIRYIQFGFLTNVESLFFPFWLLSTFTRFAFYFYISSLLFGTIFKIRQFEYIIPTLATVTVLLGSIPETPTFSIFYLRVALLHTATPIFLLLPFLLWVLAKLKGDVKPEKTKTS